VAKREQASAFFANADDDEDSFVSQEERSLQEEQEKWTKMEEMNEHKKLEEELDAIKKQQEELMQKNE